MEDNAHADGRFSKESNVSQEPLASSVHQVGCSTIIVESIFGDKTLADLLYHAIIMKIESRQ